MKKLFTILFFIAATLSAQAQAQTDYPHLDRILFVQSYDSPNASVLVDSAWDNFAFPTIDFQDQASTTKGSSIYRRLITDREQFIGDHCLMVAKKLYFNDNDNLQNITMVHYYLQNYNGISQKSGSPPEIEIDYSTQWIESNYKSGGDSMVMYEAHGVLCHELTHAYQFEPQGAGDYQQGTEFYAFIEGLADAIRYECGYVPLSNRQIGGNWLDGYQTTGFFLDWLTTKDTNFVRKFNRSATSINPWSWDKAIKSILGKQYTTQGFWNEYQNYLAHPNSIALNNPDNIVPKEHMLLQNYPNPFNPTTAIRYQLSAVSRVKLDVFDVLGREVAVLVDDTKEAGFYSATFHASQLASGTYFARITVQPLDGKPFAQVRKMLLTK